MTEKCEESEGVTGGRILTGRLRLFIFKEDIMKITIGTLEMDATAKISGYTKEAKPFKEKLLSMGLTRGTEIKVVRVAPLGDPIEINTRGFNLSLRKAEADVVLVERG